MLEIQRIRTEKEAVIEGLKKRNIDATATVEEILKKDQEWRESKSELESIAAELNQIAKEIGDLFKQGKQAEANAAKERTTSLKGKEAQLKEVVSGLENEIQQLMYTLPNVPNEQVKAGKNELDNEIVDEVGSKHIFDGEPLPHWELTKKYDLIDFELGVKITGAGFPVYKGKGAKLQRALIQFFLDEAEKAGYEEFIPPHVVNEASGIGTGQLPDKEGQMYHCTVDDLYLIPTAEVPLTNIYRDVILPDENFSIKMTGYTPCFRREAGSYGKDVRGLNRLHQFDKVEIVRIEHPDNTAKALDEMVEHVRGLLAKLGLHYRILRLCGGDTGFASAMTYDFEVFSAAQEKWLEVSSVSRFDTFQANRLKLRFKTADKKTQLAHTLNGSALALPRIVAALLENYQNADGSITIPEVLVPYTKFDKIG
ncbi:MAG: serine--tRNA ligase [Flavobacteriia bacterium]|nr:serine--tRNA ligase [Flavobacteriia bacterium]OJX36730.1 MAG: serine--tRNA ligase [Flavobacteriia bacterium 40-80]